MYFTDEEILEFQALYEKRFHKKISKSEAIEKGLNLVNLVKLAVGQNPLDKVESKINKP